MISIRQAVGIAAKEFGGALNVCTVAAENKGGWVFSMATAGAPFIPAPGISLFVSRDGKAKPINSGEPLDESQGEARMVRIGKFL